ncbi:proteasome activator complex subunit 3-like isoform X7 [Aphis gossypii]|uniref:proteasome activator complex subunit 3-like isoform X6 n=1 Tax=Aphis gossypii TaxID=80765 RepID=UPI002158B6C9|nr:proteasome activator complex subunit 3-like isoform X6 [Aphis gossypii]XP_050062064.1 proteasome activator complex subunit 3-like isoform X7 [Aphis gossypii]XP_050062065.1 proteasome activator complex subunit 3-like isoform X8 [Aphis gossypii]XP_050062066.1 proteasome activator complex subunit 3-like isoform X9 [Aphis gossypii]XP_050065462.1 proteasome activator complex subunit 3-like isoform X6 [Aphis gossypii]XP_050065463.1 proteasome activator complex subunit 3-like isoform X7 [Aphis gos
MVKHQLNLAKELHETLQADAENLLVQKFPERILHLNELLKMPEFEVASNVMKLECNKNSDFISGQTLIPSNKKIIEVMEIVKPNLKQLIDDAKALAMWVSLLIPKIEDGNNFGVSVQEETISAISDVEITTGKSLIQISHYNLFRAQLISKVCKYPLIEDYQYAVAELDERQCFFLSLAMHDARNSYSTMHELVIKNFDKIKKPRSSNNDCLY